MNGRSSFLSRFARDERGLSMLEFSFIAPVMIVMFFGIAELGQGLFAQRRNAHVASAIGDLAAQAGSISNADMSNIMDAGGQVMAPLSVSTSTLGMRITYKYTSPVGYVLPNGMSFSNKSYLSPRLGSVTRTT